MSIRMRHTRGHSANRRSHHALTQIKVVKNEDGSMRLPHRLDESTGMYRGKQIVTPRVKATKEERVEQHDHEHTHTAVKAAEVAGSKGIMGKIASAALPKARRGAGGGGA